LDLDPTVEGEEGRESHRIRVPAWGFPARVPQEVDDGDALEVPKGYGDLDDARLVTASSRASSMSSVASRCGAEERPEKVQVPLIFGP
jgi:hypothetical protein